MRFQQLTGPVMAKGVEDTAFYRYLRLLALNEVGGDPGRFGADAPTAFHAAGAACAASGWPARDARHLDPRHQAQRGRARPARCSCPRSPSAGPRRSRAGRRGNARHRRPTRLPDRNAEYLLLPDAGRRLADRRRPAARRTSQKALREAKVHTSWTHPDAAYEAAVADSSRAALDDTDVRRRARALRRAARPVPGRINALAQTPAEADRARRARPLPGHRALGPAAWSIPTTAGRSTTRSGPSSSGPSASARRPSSEPRSTIRPIRPAQAAPDPCRARSAPAPARGVRRGSGVSAPRCRRSGGRATAWPSPGATGDPTGPARTSSRSSCRGRRQHPAVARITSVTVGLPAGAGVTCSAGSACGAGACVRSSELLGPLPIALLERPDDDVPRLGTEPGTVELALGDGSRRAMERAADGWWSAEVAEARAGTDYGYLLDGEGPFPDPRSASQPNGVHGLSRVVDHGAFDWTSGAIAAHPVRRFGALRAARRDIHPRGHVRGGDRAPRPPRRPGHHARSS